MVIAGLIGATIILLIVVGRALNKWIDEVDVFYDT